MKSGKRLWETVAALGVLVFFAGCKKNTDPVPSDPCVGLSTGVRLLACGSKNWKISAIRSAGDELTLSAAEKNLIRTFKTDNSWSDNAGGSGSWSLDSALSTLSLNSERYPLRYLNDTAFSYLAPYNGPSGNPDTAATWIFKVVR